MPQTTPTPTAEEQLLLELVNRARGNPQGEYAALVGTAEDARGVQANIAQALGYFGVDLAALRAQLEGLAPAAPLAWNAALARAAGTHNALMRDLDRQEHVLPGEAGLGDRIEAAGYDAWYILRENIYAYAEDMVHAHAGFFIDWGHDAEDFNGGSLRSDWQRVGDGIQDPAGHRLSILYPGLHEVGISALADSDPLTRVGPLLVTQDFGARSDYAAQLLGVMVDDRDGDGFYGIGEGLAGVTVRAEGAAGVFTAETWGSGGYQMVLPAGEYTVTFSGGGLMGEARYSVTMTGANIKLDGFLADVSAGLILTGTDGPDLLLGGPGHDRLFGGAGNDTLYGGDGADTLNGGDGDDFLFGGDTEADLRDVIYGGEGDDRIDGGWGNDELWGGAGNDTILGDYGSDTLIGNEGHDQLHGGAGSDEIHGGPGDDWINGGWGYDRLNGGTGADTFFHQGVADHGSDWVQDYRFHDGDVLAVGIPGATRDQFQANFANTPGAGSAEVAEAFVIYKPTQQILFALVDGAGQDGIVLRLSGQDFDLLA